MLDISRDRVPDRACLLSLLDRMARVRLNHLELYTEPLLTDSGLLDAYLSTLHQPNRSSHA